MPKAHFMGKRGKMHGRLVLPGGHGTFAAMLEEDFLPQKKKPQLKVLDNLSIDELRDYIEEMKTEITRVEAAIARKKASADAASLFFKK